MVRSVCLKRDEFGDEGEGVLATEAIVALAEDHAHGMAVDDVCQHGSC